MSVNLSLVVLMKTVSFPIVEIFVNFMKIVTCLPTEHLGVLMNSLKRVRAFQIELEFGVLVFKERGKPEYPEKNQLEQGRILYTYLFVAEIQLMIRVAPCSFTK